MLPPPLVTGLRPASAAWSIGARSGVSGRASSQPSRRPASERVTEPATSNRKPSPASGGMTRSMSQASAARLWGKSEPTKSAAYSRSPRPRAARARARSSGDGAWTAVSSKPFGMTASDSSRAP